MMSQVRLAGTRRGEGDSSPEMSPSKAARDRAVQQARSIEKAAAAKASGLSELEWSADALNSDNEADPDDRAAHVLAMQVSCRRRCPHSAASGRALSHSAAVALAAAAVACRRATTAAAIPLPAPQFCPLSAQARRSQAAISANRADMVETLLQGTEAASSRGDPNERIKNGKTPLTLAASSGLYDITASLLSHGADPSSSGTRPRLPGTSASCCHPVRRELCAALV